MLELSIEHNIPLVHLMSIEYNMFNKFMIGDMIFMSCNSNPYHIPVCLYTLSTGAHTYAT